MEKQKQVELIKGLIANVQKDIEEESAKYPESWDGIELRWRIADVFSQVVFGQSGKRKGKRYQEYRNTVLINGMI